MSTIATRGLKIVIGVVLILIGLRTIGEADGGIDDLNARLILIRLQGLIFGQTEIFINHTRLMIRIEPIYIKPVFFGIFLILDGVMPRFQPHGIIVDESNFSVLARFTSVPERRICKELILGQRAYKISVIVTHRILREKRNDNCKQDKDQNDRRADNRPFVLAEPGQSVAHITAGFGGKFLVMHEIPCGSKGKLLFGNSRKSGGKRRDFFHFFVFHITSPPF